jgi:hydrogenase expression/formation protein HypD
MKFIDEFRDGEAANGLTQQIVDRAGETPMTFMEVCGTHTMSIHRHGLKQILPPNIRLISGPGCPVCVTSNAYIDRAVAYARLDRMTICTFGDMLRVPGSTSSLDQERAKGCDVRVVYSPLDAVDIAAENPDQQVIFLGVGFETTSPTVAAAIQAANHRNISNFFVSCAHKTIPNAMASLVSDDEIQLDGFICPAHVSTIIGSRPYEFLANRHRKACAIIGFEPLDILQGLVMLVTQVVLKQWTVENQYRRVAKVDGNQKALALLNKVFEPCDDEWRGLGVIKGSGLTIRPEYSAHDAEQNITVKVEETVEPKGCICGLILQGKKIPSDCELFAKACTPQNPIGACMVSSEGTCAAHYKYSRY